MQSLTLQPPVFLAVREFVVSALIHRSRTASQGTRPSLSLREEEDTSRTGQGGHDDAEEEDDKGVNDDDTMSMMT